MKKIVGFCFALIFVLTSLVASAVTYDWFNHSNYVAGNLARVSKTKSGLERVAPAYQKIKHHSAGARCGNKYTNGKYVGINQLSFAENWCSMWDTAAGWQNKYP